MSVKYRLVPRKNLKAGAEPDSRLLYASANVSGTMDFEGVCNRIADRSTASDGDVALVLKGLVKCLTEGLQRGESIDLGDMGKFRVSLGSSGVETPEEFNVSMIRKPRIVFFPGKAIRLMLEDIKLERISDEEESGSSENEEEIPSGE